MAGTGMHKLAELVFAVWKVQELLSEEAQERTSVADL